MDVAFILDRYFKGKENGFWQGTLIYMEIGTNEEIDPNQIVEASYHFPRTQPVGRAQCVSCTPTQI